MTMVLRRHLIFGLGITGLFGGSALPVLAGADRRLSPAEI